MAALSRTATVQFVEDESPSPLDVDVDEISPSSGATSTILRKMDRTSTLRFHEVSHQHGLHKIRVQRTSSQGVFAPSMEEETNCCCCTPWRSLVRQYMRIIYMISKRMPDIHVNSEGDDTHSLAFVLASVALVLVLTVLGPVLLPVAVVYTATCGAAPSGYMSLNAGPAEPETAAERYPAFLRWTLTLILTGLSALPLYLLWSMTVVVFDEEVLMEFMKPENPMLELWGPYVCLLILSLTCHVDVYQCCIENGAGQMLLDEMREMIEQDAFMVKIAKGTTVDEKEVDHLIPSMQDLVRYMDVHIQEKEHGLFTTQRRLTSHFMYAVFQVIRDEIQDTDKDEEEDPSAPLRAQLEQFSASSVPIAPPAVAVLLMGSLGPALLPALVRLANGYQGLWSHDGVWTCQRAYLFMAFLTSMRLIGACYGLIDSLGRLQLATLAALYLAAPRRRRAVLAAMYRPQFDKLLFLPDHVPLAPARELSSDLERRYGGFARFRCVFVANKLRGKGLEFRNKESMKQEDDQQAQIPQEDDANASVTYLAARKFAFLQLLTRTDCLVLEGKSEAVMLVLAMILTLVSVLLVYSVGLTDGQHHYNTLAFGSLILLGVLAVMLSIVNNLVSLERLLLDDTLKILQSWRERLERLRYGVTSTLFEEDNLKDITFLDNYLCSLIDPVAGLIDYTKNWQKPVSLFGVTASSTRRNRVVLSLLAYFAVLLWQLLKQQGWYIALQQELAQIAESHGVHFS
ncbi:unnamed protein product [Symbiodinium sp. CCMP2456]|nr:unnamed protein product [Symbiodinium sp. CCMP2456]